MKNEMDFKMERASAISSKAGATRNELLLISDNAGMTLSPLLRSTLVIGHHEADLHDRNIQVESC